MNSHKSKGVYHRRVLFFWIPRGLRSQIRLERWLWQLYFKYREINWMIILMKIFWNFDVRFGRILTSNFQFLNSEIEAKFGRFCILLGRIQALFQNSNFKNLTSKSLQIWRQIFLKNKQKTAEFGQKRWAFFCQNWKFINFEVKTLPNLTTKFLQN